MGKVMKIYIKYFASIRDLIGKDSENLDVDINLSARELWQLLTHETKSPENVLVAVNHKYVDFEHVLKDGDEIAFFPPVTGG